MLIKLQSETESESLIVYVREVFAETQSYLNILLIQRNVKYLPPECSLSQLFVEF